MRQLQIAQLIVIWSLMNLSTQGVWADPQGATTGPATSRPAEQNEIVTTLMHGNSAARLDALKRVVSSSPKGFDGVDDALFPAIASCADDPSAATRSQAAVLIGIRWIQSLPTPMPQALVVEEKLARDPDAQVRHDAVSAGLRRIKDKPDAMVDALIDAAMQPGKYDGPTNGLYQVIIPIKAYTGFLDRPIERRGLEPDVPVRCRASDLAAGRDTVVDTASQWLSTVPQN